MTIDPIFLIVALVISVVLHEVSHGYVAEMLGDPTARLAGRLTLNPLKHLDPFGSIFLPFLLWLLHTGFIFGWAKPVPYNPYNLRAGRWGPAIVAAAGPASNLLIALFFSQLLRFGLIPVAAINLTGFLVLLNLMLAVFNLIPLPPLDGSKILFAVLPNRWLGVEEWWLRHQFLILIALILFISYSNFLETIVFGLFHLLVG